MNWAEFTIDMAFDLLMKDGGSMSKTAEKVAGPLAKKLAPKLAETVVKKWGLEAAEKKLGAKTHPNRDREIYRDGGRRADKEPDQANR